MNEAYKRTLGIWLCFVPFVGFYLIQTVVQTIARKPVYNSIPDSLTAGIVLSCIIRIVVILLYSYWYYFAFAKGNPFGFVARMRGDKRILRVKNDSIMIILSLFALCVFAFSYQLGGSTLLTLILEQMPEYYDAYMNTIDGLLNVDVPTFVYVGVLAPVCEEVIFRGLTLSYCRRRVPFGVANFLQAALFAIYHGNVIQGIYSFVSGLLLGYLVSCSSSIVPAMLTHAFINIWGLYMERILPEEVYDSMTLGVKVAVCIVSLAIAAISFAYCTFEKKGDNKA